MGVVYQARDPKIDRIVAIKTVSLEEESDEPEFRERFFLEARAAGRLSHAGIITIFDVAEDETSHAPYIVMEYVHGQTLKKLLAPGYAKVPLETALRLAEEVADALAYAHDRGVVHRDIKPANIMITEQEHAKIMDFGVAKLDRVQRTHAGVLMGTPAYMSPEQLTGQPVDGRSDIFSLGVVLYTMLVGHRPFQGNGVSTIGFKVVNRDPLPLTTINPELPAEVERIVSRAIAKELDKRYQTGAEMAADLAKMREQLRKEHADQPLPGLLTVSPPSRSTQVRSESSKPFSAAAIAQMRVEGKPGAARSHSRQPFYAVGIAVAMVVGFGLLVRHRQAPLHFASTSSSTNLVEARSTSTPASFKTTSSASAERGTSAIFESKQSAVIPEPDAHLHISIQHPFTNATMSVWIDGKLKYTEALHGKEKKKLLVFHRTQGHSYENISIPAGKHSIKVRVQSAEQHYDHASSVLASVADNETKILGVRCEKEELKLELE